MKWLEFIIPFLLKLYNWVRYRRYIITIKKLRDIEKHILNGLYNSPTPLELYQAYKRSSGKDMMGSELFWVKKEELINDLIDKKLIVCKNDGYILTKEAASAIKMDALKI